MPASSERMLQKATTLECDAIVMDLEDAVSPDKKAIARENAMQWARKNTEEGAFEGKTVVIRVNGRHTEWHEEDVLAVAESGVDAVLLPKAEHRRDIEALCDRLEKLRVPMELQIWSMIETPLGVINACEIGAASARMGALVVGIVDLANDLQCKPLAYQRYNMMYSLQRCVLAARANDLFVLDSVFIDLEDDQGFAQECEQGKELGFDGKTLIHPKSIAEANAWFSPRLAEIEHAERVIAAAEEALEKGLGVATLDGKLVELLHVRQAKRVLLRAEQIKERGR